MTKSPADKKNKPASNFIRHIIANDLLQGKNGGQVVTRFPPEPNGFLHIGHAKSICLNFSLAAENNGKCHLRFDDTNPEKEDIEFARAIQKDIEWLGFDWGENLFHASDYFDQLYEFAVQLIKLDKAYVCDLTPEQMREYRGTLTEPGKDSPGRSLSVDQNLELFEKMKRGEFKDGERVLRAKIDMASPNINLRDPVIYRVRHVEHPQTGKKWCIYPMYDYTHCLSDMIEGITHSICTLEFEDHRPLYDWVLETLQTPCHPQQIEFARLNLDYTVMSKRYLLEMVQTGVVDGWDDPRMPTISGMRRRGYPPQSIRNFCERIGVTKKDTCIEYGYLETCVRDDLNELSSRAFAVLDPVKIIIENYPEDKEEMISVKNHPTDEERGLREMPMSREVYIEREDFEEIPPEGFRRLAPGQEVRLRYGYLVKCTSFEKDADGRVTLIRCEYDDQSLGGKSSDGRKVKGIIHWVSAKHAQDCEVRVYDRLFNVPDPMAKREGQTFRDFINPDSLKIISNAQVEPTLMEGQPGDTYQFERVGYFCVDTELSSSGRPVFNRVVTLRDSWGY